MNPTDFLGSAPSFKGGNAGPSVARSTSSSSGIFSAPFIVVDSDAQDAQRLLGSLTGGAPLGGLNLQTLALVAGVGGLLWLALRR